MLKQGSLEATLIGPLEGVLQPVEELDDHPYHRDDDLSELALLKHEIGEMRREIRQARDKLDESLRVTKRRDRARLAAQARRQRGTRGGAIARAILSLMVAVFTLAGAIAGIGVGLTVIHVWGDNAVAIAAAAVSGLAAALCTWLLAALAAIVLETADGVRNLPV